MKYLLKIFTLLLLTSCGSLTNITGYWNEQSEMGKQYNKIAVIPITSSIENRTVIEQKFVEKFTLNGYNAIGGSKLLSPEVIKRKDREEIKKILEDNGVDGVLLISLLDIKETEYYVPGSVEYQPRAYYNHYYDYYYHTYDRVYTPGYYDKSVSIFLESNFYNLKDDKLVSTMQTETADPMHIADLADSFSETIVKFMIENRIITKNTQTQNN